MNDDEEHNNNNYYLNPSSLESIRTYNKTQWAKLEQIRKEIDSNTINNDNCGSGDWNLDAATCLRAELEVLLMRRSAAPELIVPIDDYFHSLYGDELMQTYNDLVQTNIILNNNVPSSDTQLVLKQQQVIQTTLLQWLEEQQQNRRKKKQRQTTETAEKNTAKQQHLEWLRNELVNVSNVLENRCQQEEEQQEDDNNNILSSRQNHINSNDKGTIAPSNGFLSKLILQLLSKRLAKDINDPYVNITTLNSHEALAIPLLEQCGVIQYHPEDSNYICLVDFTK